LEFVDFGQTPIEEGMTIRTDLENKYLPQMVGQEWHTVMSNDGIMTAAALNQVDEVYQVSFELTEKGKNIFLEHTTKNVGSYLGIVLDKSVISVPIIQQPITYGEGAISGNFTQEAAEELAAVLQTKPLPFSLKLKQ
jgi:preprotein translocase subunit SecD